MDQFILFGDSITQQCFDQEYGRGFFGPALTNHYVRRLDIVNRGFSGYNTFQALKVLPKFMSSPQQASVRFMMIFFGANDARLPNTPGGPDQHVPLEEFQSNLRKIATHQCIKAHQDIRIILVTPPPVDERSLVEADQTKYPGMGAIMRRTAVTTAKYAQAVRDLGDELQMPVLDIWTAMLEQAGYSAKNRSPKVFPGSTDDALSYTLEQFLHDGLHFSHSAYELLFQELIALIERRWPDQAPERLPFVLPAWDDEEAWMDHTSAGPRNML
jgi:lysophospholipase L1-like esterase